MTHDQGRGVARHAELSQNTGIAVYFAGPHRPWQRGTNKNANGIIRHYLPKGANLSKHSQKNWINSITFLVLRPTGDLNWLHPIEALTRLMGLQHGALTFAQ